MTQRHDAQRAHREEIVETFKLRFERACAEFNMKTHEIKRYLEIIYELEKLRGNLFSPNNNSAQILAEIRICTTEKEALEKKYSELRKTWELAIQNCLEWTRRQRRSRR